MTLRSEEEIQNNEGHGWESWKLAEIPETIIVFCLLNVIDILYIYKVQKQL